MAISACPCFAFLLYVCMIELTGFVTTWHTLLCLLVCLFASVHITLIGQIYFMQVSYGNLACLLGNIILSMVAIDHGCLSGHSIIDYHCTSHYLIVHARLFCLQVLPLSLLEKCYFLSLLVFVPLRL